MAAELGKPQSQSKYIQDEPDATRQLGGSLQAAQAAHSFSSGVSGSGFCGASLAWWPIRSRSFSGISSNARSSGVTVTLSPFNARMSWMFMRWSEKIWSLFGYYMGRPLMTLFAGEGQHQHWFVHPDCRRLQTHCKGVGWSDSQACTWYSANERSLCPQNSGSQGCRSR
ncbi:hypothetical protein KL942_003098 [Ogataea angusta]|uniref:Uncharacterized protein n=1 Tax=Pichia angusta TaxID=870730 RepID=A0ABQ7RQK6_PICAN|nr:hypothetical protein KL942_003098 [Ogataea angusta]KAG7845852.1 hypothetical protein KL940_004897 [Ogataea angusta]